MVPPPLSELSIEELIFRARAEEEGAIEELLRRCQPSLEGASRHATRKRSGSVRPSDVSQEAAILAFQRFSTFKGSTKGELISWFKRIATRQASQLLRDEQRKKRGAPGTLPLDAAEALEVPAPQRSPSQFTARKEEWYQLQKTLSQLPEDQCEALRLFYMEGMSVKEVSGHMERTEASVGSLLQRGLRALRDRMAEKPGTQGEGPSPVDAAFRVYLRRREAGEVVDPDTFAAEFEDCTDELRELLHWMERLQALRQPPSSS
ncbi:sigma-70 family RNA polymerase sigma factor [Hyalangium sp.]|uniref:RNA polymerase sigma factor n=1 Tax=Hyalangium sp. TaxID=2028555 RepID=UPI002D398462|nr:sigma-70 family RNA polymerase sigma factor [Hyalangium sp.]HYI01572.1 sigma-70 family RNA polymerase sigma factor [Hyalangium sp.]